MSFNLLESVVANIEPIQTTAFLEIILDGSDLNFSSHSDKNSGLISILKSETVSSVDISPISCVLDLFLVISIIVYLILNKQLSLLILKILNYKPIFK